MAVQTRCAAFGGGTDELRRFSWWALRELGTRHRETRVASAAVEGVGRRIEGPHHLNGAGHRGARRGAFTSIQAEGKAANVSDFRREGAVLQECGARWTHAWGAVLMMVYSNQCLRPSRSAPLVPEGKHDMQPHAQQLPTPQAWLHCNYCRLAHACIASCCL